MKRAVLTVTLTVLFLMLMPVAVFLTGWCVPAQFDETYYGELADMYERLTSSEKKKIVLIGTSGVAFGVEAAVADEEFEASGLGEYEVCKFGLYGALGTKLMMDLSRDHIGEGDIVLFMPEFMDQTMSLYFSASDTWYSFDSSFGMFWELDSDNMGSMIGSYAGFAAEKVGYARDGKPQGSGIYAHSSFDEYGDLTNASRPYNTMSGGYDPDSMITFDSELWTDDFVEYVNEYYEDISNAGAEMYYCFSPMNASAVTDASEETIDAYAEYTESVLDFGILGNPEDSIMEAEWFYDSNFHLNESGSIAYTAGLCESLKTRFGVTNPSSIEIPDMPEMPEETDDGEGDNEDADCFVYEDVDGVWTVTGLTDEGALRTSLTVPYTAEGQTVTAIAVEALQNDTVLEEIVIQENITRLRDSMFSGCTALQGIYLRQEDPSEIDVAFNLLDGVSEDCIIYVPADSLTLYIDDYFWGHYMGNIAGYET